MLTNKRILNVLFLVMFLTLGLSAQEGTKESNNDGYRQGGWWTFGINGGLSYQSSDVCRTYDGWGVGLTLAKNVYYKPNAPLALDLRGRLLYANQKGEDWERSFGLQNNIALNGNSGTRDFIEEYDLNYLNNPSLTSDSSYYANYRNDLAELGLEAVINLNRLREKRNIILNLYGGLNLDWYRTRVDQANDLGGLTGTEYDYSGITSTDKATALSQLDGLRDGTYETVADGFDREYGTFTWMPSAGIELGYQLTPKFSIVGGHKVTWSRADIMDGQQWTDDNLATGNNDIYHYTNVGLRWIIDPAESTMDPPLIKIIRPKPLPYSTQNAYVNVKAEIENVSSAADVSCVYNGSAFNNFNFNPNSENFNCGLNLVPGRNELVITATNMVGQDVESVVIIYNEPQAPQPEPTRQPPIVDITRPSTSNTTVNVPNYDLKAVVRYVNSKSNVKFYFNGSTTNSFSFNASTSQLNAPLTLQEGKNTIRIVGTNEDGTAEDQTVIIYEEPPCPEPTVRINNISVPVATPMNPNLAKSNVSATVENASSRSQIKMYVNGDRFTDFSYTASTGSIKASISLAAGRNEVRIVVSTDCGRDEDVEVVTFNATTPTNPTPPPNPTPQPTPQPPIVDISTPNNGASTFNSTINMVATVKHVTNKNQIRVTLNGSNYNNFSFSAFNKTVKANNIPLNVGNNVIEVKATNNYGTDSDDVLIIRKTNATPPPPPPCPVPMVNIDNISVPVATPMNPNNAKSTMKATTQNVSSKSQIQLFINNSKTSNFSFNSGTGKISASFDMNPGTTTIKLVVSTGCGNDSDTETVNFEGQQIPKPVVNIIKPQNNQSFTTPTTQLSATVLNVNSKSDITVKVNGIKTNNFSFNSSSNNVSATINLTSGTNTIMVSASNTAGTDNDSKSVKYNEPQTVNPPVVNIVKPQNNQNFTKSTTQLSATVLNVDGKSDITVKVNGVKTNNFTYNTSNNNVIATVGLNNGKNTLQVSANNSAGSDSDTKTVNYNEPQPAIPPVVNINKPSNGSTVNTQQVDLKSTVLNVTKKSDVTVKLNGSNVSNFSFAGTSVTAKLTLKQGNNTIQVIGKNKDGQDQKSVTVKYVKPTPPPTVTITTPSDNLTVEKADYTVKANITNVKKKTDITFTVNGKRINLFTYNVAAGKLSAPITLKEGNNNIVIKVRNQAGTDEDSKVVTYKKSKPYNGNKPTVNIQSISVPVATPMNPNVGKSNLVVKTRFVANARNITVTLNGKLVNGLSFDKTKGELTGQLNLKKGDNVVTVKAKNPNGETTDTEKVTF